VNVPRRTRPKIPVALLEPSSTRYFKKESGSSCLSGQKVLGCGQDRREEQDGKSDIGWQPLPPIGRKCFPTDNVWGVKIGNLEFQKIKNPPVLVEKD
jgi:hypothetical protein